METKRIEHGMRTSLATALVVAVAVVGGHGMAAAATLCMKPSGVLAARDGKCKKKEVVMPASLLQGEEGAQGPQGPAGTTGSPGAPGAPGAPGKAGDPAGARIVDSTGKTVGVADYYDDVLVMFPNYGPAVVWLSPSQVVDTHPVLTYESTDCSGSPLVPPDTFDLLMFAEVHGNDLWLPGSPKASHTTKSKEKEDPNCNANGGNNTPRGMCCYTGGTTADFVPAVHFDVSAAVGTPPFSVAH